MSDNCDEEYEYEYGSDNGAVENMENEDLIQIENLYYGMLVTFFNFVIDINLIFRG